MSIFDHSSVRFQTLIDKIQADDRLNRKVLPGFAGLLENIVDKKVDVPREESVRRLLKVLWQSETDSTYSDVLATYQPHEQQQIRAFVQGSESAAVLGKTFTMGPSIGARDELPIVDVDGVGIPDNLESDISGSTRADSPDALAAPNSFELYDDEKRKNKILVYTDEKFQNWGRTVSTIPHLTFIPRTSFGIQQIIRYAKAHKMNVRASGYRHSWAPLFAKDNQILISTLGLTRSSEIPNIESLPGSEFFMPHTQLNSIDLIGTPKAVQKRLVRVGTAVTSQQFRRWCNSRNAIEASTLPLNVIMVEITFGGSNAPICHGAGRSHTTLSDLVYAIEYVDADGNMQTLTKDKDPQFMTVAAGAFGLLGIVTHLTLEVDAMSWAEMAPRKLPVMQAIPPPPGLKDEDIPEPLRISMTPQERAKAQAEFEAHAKHDFYSEWFWFPFTSQVWVNCWNATQDSAGALETYPSHGDVFLQFVETVLIQMIQRSAAILDLQQLFPWVQTTLMSKMALYALPNITDSKVIKCSLPDGLHFRRAVQNVRVMDMEIEIPLQPKHGLLKDARPNDEVDWTLVQRAWWDAILLAYKHQDTCPQRMPLEMRITGASNMVMAPYRGNTLGTCSIEVLTLEMMKKPWKNYTQEVMDLWMAYKDKEGNYLGSRPHWAKEWYGLNVRGEPILDYLRKSYAGPIAEFNETMAQIAARQGWKITDQRERFSNDLFDTIFLGRVHDNGVVNSSAVKKENSDHVSGRFWCDPLGLLLRLKSLFMGNAAKADDKRS